MELLEGINTWILIRYFGLLAYLFFTLSVVFGIIGSFQAFKKGKALLHHIHLSSSWLGLLSILIHMLLLLIDQYQPYTIKELLIPMAAAYKPILSGLGTISFFLFLLVMVTADLMVKLKKLPIWKKLHFLVFPSWLGMLFHGIFIGTDSFNAAIASFYAGSCIMVVCLVILRMMKKSKRSKQGNLNFSVKSKT